MTRPAVDEVLALEERLGYFFLDRGLLEAALTHPSALPVGVVRAGEQLEFLGDAALSLVIADLLLRAFPDCDEGELSKRRAALVRTSALAAKARQLGLGEVLRLGRGEDRSGGREKASILAAVYEAVVAAVYRDAGFERTKALVGRHFASDIAGGAPVDMEDWKTMLQEHTQARLRTTPEYRLAGEEGPAHARQFTSEVWIAGACLASGAGSSKREAEQQAARAAIQRLAETEAEN